MICLNNVDVMFYEAGPTFITTSTGHIGLLNDGNLYYRTCTDAAQIPSNTSGQTMAEVYTQRWFTVVTASPSVDQ